MTEPGWARWPTGDSPSASPPFEIKADESPSPNLLCCSWPHTELGGITFLWERKTYPNFLNFHFISRLLLLQSFAQLRTNLKKQTDDNLLSNVVICILWAGDKLRRQLAHAQQREDSGQHAAPAREDGR